MRESVKNFTSLGKLPDEEATPGEIETFEKALNEIQPPVTDEEAAKLIECFGPDDCFGLSWSLVHLIETSPTPLPTSPPTEDDNSWKSILFQRKMAAEGS